VCVLAGSIGLSVLSMSYAGELTVAVRANAIAFTDLPVLVHAMRREWSRLSAADQD